MKKTYPSPKINPNLDPLLRPCGAINAPIMKLPKIKNSSVPNKFGLIGLSVGKAKFNFSLW